MKNKKITVSIGIPAYNEEANIKNLLLSLIAQKQIGFKIKEIIVLSDGSTDKTVSNAKSVGSNLIRIINGNARKGKVVRQNEILKLVKSDSLVLLDADVIPANRFFLGELIHPILQDKADLVSARITPLPPSNLFEKTINFSSKIKNDFFEKFVEVNGVYLCHGRVRAFSKALYKKIKWPLEIKSGEDAYSYFFCITNGFRFSYQKQAKILYRSPNTLSDHTKQSVRFIQSKKHMRDYFNKEEVNKGYRVNRNLFLRNILQHFISNPIFSSFYLIIYFFSNLLSFVKRYDSQLWDISMSSKKL